MIEFEKEKIRAIMPKMLEALKKKKFDANLPGVRYSLNAIKDILTMCKENKLPISLFYFSWPTNSQDHLLEHLENTVNPDKVSYIGKWFEGANKKHYSYTSVYQKKKQKQKNTPRNNEL